MSSESAPTGPFPSTSWTFIARAGKDGEAARQALAELLKRYLPALRAYLVHQKQRDPDGADDLLQGFVASQVLERHLVSQADPRRGRFRNLLLAALNHYLANRVRDENRAKRNPGSGSLVSLDEQVVGQEMGPAEAFEVAWGRQTIDEALLRMRQNCEAQGRAELWGLFNARVVTPALENAPALSYDRLIEDYGFQTPGQATNAMVTAKRIFARILRSLVAEYAQSEAEVDEEIRHFFEIFAKPRRGGRIAGQE